ncbi:Histidine triad nucleotide-binding protein 3 [Haplosporangium sp. Z 27]|nr:Histidine triad nucleotide-binding protein 3 [Haplosporangium sp. Z 27]
MYQKGIELLRENGHNPEESKLGFHVPPFNTVDHLHLHVLGGKFKSNIKKLKYESGRRWYMDLVQLKENLEKQQKAQQSARL